jgi:hypothetical protein
MYLDSARDVRPDSGPGQPRVSFARVKAHMDKLEATMVGHLAFYDSKKKASGTGLGMGKTAAGSKSKGGKTAKNVKRK